MASTTERRVEELERKLSEVLDVVDAQNKTIERQSSVIERLQGDTTAISDRQKAEDQPLAESVPKVKSVPRNIVLDVCEPQHYPIHDTEFWRFDLPGHECQEWKWPLVANPSQPIGNTAQLRKPKDVMPSFQPLRDNVGRDLCPPQRNQAREGYNIIAGDIAECDQISIEIEDVEASIASLSEPEIGRLLPKNIMDKMLPSDPATAQRFLQMPAAERYAAILAHDKNSLLRCLKKSGPAGITMNEAWEIIREKMNKTGGLMGYLTTFVFGRKRLIMRFQQRKTAVEMLLEDYRKKWRGQDEDAATDKIAASGGQVAVRTGKVYFEPPVPAMLGPDDSEIEDISKLR